MSKIWIKPQQVDITQDPGLSPPVAPKEDLGLGVVDANSTYTTTTSTNVVNNIYITRNGPGGRSGEVQFNADGSYIGDSGLTYEPHTDTLTTGTIEVNQLKANRANLGSINYLTILGGNVGEVLKTNGSGILTWSSAFPSDVGNSGKFLMTNGVGQQWSNVSYANLVDIPTNIATQSYVSNAIANLIDSSPAALNTLNELATALGNNANYSTEITNILANKASISYVDNSIANVTWGNLSGRPTIPAAQINSDWNENNLASKAYIQNKPTIGNIANINITSDSTQILYGNGVFAHLPAGVDLGDFTINGSNLSSTSNEVNIITTGGYTQLQNNDDTDGDTYVWLETGNVNIEADGKTWIFDNSGDLMLPLNGNIVNNGNVWGFGSTGNLTLPNQGVINDELVPIQTVTIAFRPSFPGSVDQSPTLQLASGTTSGTLGAVLLHLVNPTGSWVNYNNTLVYIGSNDGTHINLYEGFPGTVFNSLEITSGQFDSGTISVLQSQINLVAGDSQWSFSPNGNLTLPAGGDILDSTGTSVLGNPFDQNLNTTDSPRFDDIEIHGNIIANGSINIYSTEGRDIQIFTDWESGNGVEVWLRHDDGIHLVTENGEFTWQFNTDGSMYLPTFTNDWTACTTPALSGGITFSTNSLDEGAHGTTRYANINLDRNSLLLSVYNESSSSWRFSEDGNLTLPAGGDILDSTGTSVLGVSTYGNSNVVSLMNAFDANPISNVGSIQFNGGTKYIYMDTTTSGAQLSMHWNEAHGFNIGEDGFDFYTYTGTASDYNHWTLSTTGNLTLPSGGIIRETSIPGGGLTGNTIALKPDGGINDNQQLLIYPTGGQDYNHLHLTSGDLYTTELYLGNDDLYVKINNNGNIVINSNDNIGNTAQWNFKTDGAMLATRELKLEVLNGIPTGVTKITSNQGWDNTKVGTNLPTTGGSGTGLTVDVVDSGSYYSGITINTPGSGYTIGDVITVSNGGMSDSFTIDITGTKTWEFGMDGNLTLPEGGDILDSTGTSVLGGGGAPATAEPNFDIKTASFSATSGSRYGVDTTTSAVTATLPATPATGDAIWFADAGGAYSTNNLIVARNGKTIMGSASNMTVSVDNQSFGLFYNGTTWRVY